MRRASAAPPQPMPVFGVVRDPLADEARAVLVPLALRLARRRDGSPRRRAPRTRRARSGRSPTAPRRRRAASRCDHANSSVRPRCVKRRARTASARASTGASSSGESCAQRREPGQQPLAVADTRLRPPVPPVDREQRAQPAGNQGRPRRPDRNASGTPMDPRFATPPPPQTTTSCTLAADSRRSKAAADRSGRVGLRVGLAPTRRTPRRQMRPGLASQLARRAHDDHDSAQHHEARDDRNRHRSTGNAREHAQGTPAIPNAPAHGRLPNGRPCRHISSYPAPALPGKR